jgi:hypothetical protein
MRFNGMEAAALVDCSRRSSGYLAASMRRFLTASFLATLIGIAVAACGPAPAAVRVTSPMTELELRVFDHGVDFVDDPEILAGQWRRNWGDELQARVGSADIIMLTRVNSAQATRIPDVGPSYRLDIEPSGALFGASSDVDLVSAEGHPGYSSIDRNQSRLLAGDFVLFVKWYRADDRSLDAHWHLSPATEAVTSRVRFLIDSRRTAPANRPRRIVREN